MLSLRFVVAALLVLGLSWRAHAWCDGDSFSRNAPGSTIASGPVALAGIVGGIGNAVSDGGDGRASLGWRVSGFVTGALGLAAGVTTLVYSTGGGDCTGGAGFGPGIGVGIANLAIAVVDFALPLLRRARSPEAPRQVSLVPLAGVGVRGTAFAGLGLRLISF